MRLRRSVFRYIEAELFDYDDTKRAIERVRYDIIAETSKKAAGNRRGISDPTAAKASRLVTNRTLLRMSDTISAIDKALMRLSPDHRRLFELRYRSSLPWQRVCVEMPISRSGYFELRRGLVHMVAIHMGLDALD